MTAASENRTFDTGGGPHFRPEATVQKVMRDVLLALTPGAPPPSTAR
jgi:hypothetical protein